MLSVLQDVCDVCCVLRVVFCGLLCFVRCVLCGVWCVLCVEGAPCCDCALLLVVC